MTNNPLHAVQRLIDDKRSVYFSSGIASSSKGPIFFAIWGKPSDKMLARGYGNTVEEAARDALSKVPGAAPTPPMTLPGLPGLETRPSLPGMTR